VEIMLLVAPVPGGDHDVALDALRPRRLGMGQLALGDAIGQSAKYLKRGGPELAGRDVHICSPACPDWMRRDQASSDDFISPKADGIVRVARCPS